MLAVPVGQALIAAFRAFAKLLGEISPRDQILRPRQVRYTIGTAVVALAVVALAALAITSPGPRWAYAFYPEEGQADVNGVLDFARQHTDGRYLVEMVNPNFTDVSFDARAINSYLGAQGNETLSAVFHEASPNALLMLPLVNSFSQYPDSFGISSTLADDLDFSEQPIAKHLEQARLMGARYLVIRTPAMKDRLAQEPAIGDQRSFGSWSIFELKGEPQPSVRALPFRPALVFSNFTVKLRQSNEPGFTRLIEEQVADGWFDVLLARSRETKIDRVGDLDQFGALILDSYDCDDENIAFEKLKEFAGHRPLILLSSDAKLFQRIRSASAEFLMVEIIERATQEPGEALEAIKPSRRYQSSALRQQWMMIRNILEQRKISTGQDATQIASEIDQHGIQLNYDDVSQSDGVPVLINTSYHPDWSRSDGGSIYAITPFNMLTFIQQPVRINYARRWFDYVAAVCSLIALITLCLLAARQAGPKTEVATEHDA